MPTVSAHFRCLYDYRKLDVCMKFYESIVSSVDSCLQALTNDISTPADIALSALQTIIFYCFMGYISALTYYLLLIIYI